MNLVISTCKDFCTQEAPRTDGVQGSEFVKQFALPFASPSASLRHVTCVSFYQAIRAPTVYGKFRLLNTARIGFSALFKSRERKDNDGNLVEEGE